jgi:S-adenosylmethionine:tRNA ribosyltransferase-isomerase
MHPQYLSIQDFTYHLPENRIAQYPLANRHASKLLIYKNGHITEDIYRNISNHIPAHSLLIFNNSRVIEARLKFKKTSGGVIEIFCLCPHKTYPDITTAMRQQGKVYWNCLIGGASKWKPGTTLEKQIETQQGSLIIKASVAERTAENFVIAFTWQPADYSFAEVLHLSGQIPLPPYIKRTAQKEDEKSYQTIDAAHSGSVAAPTAGLHFTDEIFESLQQKNIAADFVTLHVGAGTFKPVKAEYMQQHIMHAEFIDVDKTTIENILQNAAHIFCVGTTSLRTIETLYWAGVKIYQQPDITQEELNISQWEVYDNLYTDALSAQQSLQTLLQWMEQHKLKKFIAQTQILIAPDYKSKIVSGLITNFHQPQSTLLLLIAALIGDSWHSVYAYALDHDFRFLSYGDGCLLFL